MWGVMSVGAHLGAVLQSLERAASHTSRTRSDIELVAVSKKQPVSLMREYIEAAQARAVPIIFGENYVQELKAKRSELPQEVVIHLIGPLQSNKIRDAVRYADVIQSVHSLSVLEGIAHEAHKQGKQQDVFLQVNIGDDSRKSGFQSTEIPKLLADARAHSSSLRILGLMTITPFYDDPEQARPDFAKMRKLRDDLFSAGLTGAFADGKVLLSMGMSADFDVAIEEGADLVRVGTAIFGERPAT
jgi:pyridoxal phosphate enzyme (YggS family)